MMPRSSSQLSFILASLSIATLVCADSSTAQARSAPQSSASSTTVVIDAGHGGYDRGGIPSQRIPEKTMTLDVAQRLKEPGQRISRGHDLTVTSLCLWERELLPRTLSQRHFRVHSFQLTTGGAGGIETFL
jgi:hypothetical protein